MLELSTSVQQDELNKILKGLIPLETYAISDELIEAGFIANSSHEFDSAAGSKVYVTVYIRQQMKAVYIHQMLTSPEDEADIVTLVFANTSWEKLID